MEIYNYDEIRNNINSFDVFLFRGNEIVSNTISIIEKKEEQNQEAGLFTHCGIVIKGDLFAESSKYYDKNKIYIFESVLSGHFGAGIKNVDGETFFGVQLRDLDELIPAFLSQKNTHIGWCKILHKPHITKEEWMEIFNKYNHRKYDYNIIDLIASACKEIRIIRHISSFWFHHIRSWQICSELVANILLEIKMIKDIDPRDVIPADFIVNNRYNICDLFDGWHYIK